MAGRGGRSAYVQCFRVRSRLGRVALHGYAAQQLQNELVHGEPVGVASTREQEAKLGFSSHSHFTNAFRSEFGCSPSVCLFIARPERRSGRSAEVIRAAAAYAAERGTRIVEAYPVEPRQERMPDAFAGTGIAKAFRQAGFREVARRSETRPIMRWHASEKGVAE